MLIISHIPIQEVIRIDTYFFNQIMTISKKGADNMAWLDLTWPVGNMSTYA